MRFKFIDANPGYPGGGFSVTNENMKALRHLVELIPSRKRLGGICSGGEVPITVLLPMASEEVVVVDQGLTAIGPALIKLLMLERFGGAGMKVELFKRQAIDYLDLIQELPRDLGIIVLDATRHLSGSFYVWNTFDNKILDEAREKLELLTVVHGDLSEIHKFASGPLDAIYTSNAMGWGLITPDNGNRLSTQHLEPALTPDGFLFGTSPIDQYRGWKPVKTYSNAVALPQELRGNDGWSYGLWQRPTPTPAPVVVGDTSPPVTPPKLTQKYVRDHAGRFASPKSGE